MFLLLLFSVAVMSWDNNIQSAWLFVETSTVRNWADTDSRMTFCYWDDYNGEYVCCDPDTPLNDFEKGMKQGWVMISWFLDRNTDFMFCNLEGDAMIGRFRLFMNGWFEDAPEACISSEVGVKTDECEDFPQGNCVEWTDGRASLVEFPTDDMADIKPKFHCINWDATGDQWWQEYGDEG